MTEEELEYQKQLREQELKQDAKYYWLDADSYDKKDTLKRLYPHRKQVEVRPKDLKSL